MGKFLGRDAMVFAKLKVIQNVYLRAVLRAAIEIELPTALTDSPRLTLSFVPWMRLAKVAHRFSFQFRQEQL